MVSEVLMLPVLRAGGARVVAGAAGLDRRVRWVHVAEVADIAHLLRGGELVLTTGIALPSDDAALGEYVDDLAKVGVAGLVIELVRRWHDDLPAGLKAAADRHGLPLVTLTKETRYVTVSEAVISMIMEAQVAELRAAQQVHETFTALTVAGAEPAAILREVARMSGLPVVLETLAHHVLGYDAAGQSPGELLADWEHRSRAATLPGRTAYHPGEGWLVTTVGARGDDWGRLILFSPTEPPQRHTVVAERAADALALNRLVARDRDSLERQTHRSLLAALLGLPARANAEPAVRRMAREVHAVAASTAGLRDLPVVVAVGSTIGDAPDGLAQAGRSLREAAHVARAALRLPHSEAADFHGLADVRLRGLLHLFADDERLTAFVERELGPLLAPQNERLLDVLRGYCEHGGNKSAAAAAAHTSRTAYYQQLGRIEAILRVRLDDPESVLSLHVALLALETYPQPPEAG